MRRSRTKALHDAGLPEDGMLQVARTVGMNTARIAEANRELALRVLTQPGDTERELANRFAAAAEHLLPLVGPTLVYAFQANFLEQIKRDVIGAADLASGEIGGAVEMTTCFADLVEFTRLGEEIPPEELGLVAGRLEEMATAVAEPPVRLVKMIGDAVMLVSSDPAPLVRASLALIAAAEAEGDEFPWLRAGLASGPTLPQSGDYYGRSVNLASRITGIARPGSVLVDAATRDARRRGLHLLLRRRAPAQGHRRTNQTLPRPRRLTAALRPLAGGDEQVVEELGRQVRLEQAGVDLLQGDVAAEGEACASARRPTRARRSTRPCAGPSPRRWRAAPRRRRGGPRSRRRASRRRRSAGAKAWTSTSPSSAWPWDCSASGTARRLAPTRRRQAGATQHAGALRQRRQAVAVARGLAGEGDRPAGPQDAAELGEGAVEVGDVVEDGVAEDEVEALVLEGQSLGLGGDGGRRRRPRAPRRSRRAASASPARCRSRSAARSRRAAPG